MTSVRRSLLPQFQKDPKNVRLPSSPYATSAKVKIPNTLVVVPKTAYVSARNK